MTKKTSEEIKNAEKVAGKKNQYFKEITPDTERTNDTLDTIAQIQEH